MFFEKMKLKQRVGELEDQLRLVKAERDSAYEQARRAEKLADDALKDLNSVRMELIETEKRLDDTENKLDAAESACREYRERCKNMGGRRWENRAGS